MEVGLKKVQKEPFFAFYFSVFNYYWPTITTSVMSFVNNILFFSNLLFQKKKKKQWENYYSTYTRQKKTFAWNLAYVMNND